MFRLHKWFLDCTTPTGEVLIVYVASLRWGMLRLGYLATLWQRPDEVAATTRARLGRHPGPQFDSSGCTLAAPRLGVVGRWRASPAAREHTLWQGPRGTVRWHCHLPLAAAQVEFGGRTLKGTGYVEHLALEVAPWHLPIRELRWGRFHGGDRSLVWIQWLGPVPLRLCLRDGVEVLAEPIGDDGFALTTGERLRLGSPRVLRDGRLGRTVLAERLLRWLPLPRSVRAMQETKWLSPAVLESKDGSCAGTALHEVVRWP